MRRLLKGFLIALAIVAVLACAGVLVLNMYVQSAGTQARVEQALTEALRMPVHLKATSITPWGGLQVSGITVPQPEGTPGDFLNAARFNAFFQWIPLFKRRIVIDQVFLEEPRVIWRQTSGGKWLLPSELAQKKKPEPGESPVPQPSPPAAPEPRIRHKGEGWNLLVHRLRINDAAFDFRDEKDRSIVTFEGVQVECSDPRFEGTKGDFRAGHIALHEKLIFRNARSTWGFSSGKLSLEDLQTELAGGTLRGGTQMQTEMKRTPFTADVTFDNIDLDRLVSETGGVSGQFAGTLSGWLDLSGESGHPESINGSGHVALGGGQMKQYDFLQLLGKALHIDELEQLNLQKAEADCRVVQGITWVDRLLMQSPNLRLDAHGTVDQKGRLALNARLTISQNITRQLPQFIEANFAPGETPETRMIDFPITGTLAKPQTNLMEQILGRKIETEMSGLFQNLFNKGKKQKKEKQPKPGTSGTSAPEPSATISPEASPSPTTAE